MILNIFKRLFAQKRKHYIQENHGSIIPWHKGIVLTPLSPVILAIPEQVLVENEPMESVIHGPDNMEISVKSDEHRVYLRLKAGMRVWLTKSCDAVVYTDNHQPIHFEIEIPEEYQKYIAQK